MRVGATYSDTISWSLTGFSSLRAFLFATHAVTVMATAKAIEILRIFMFFSIIFTVVSGKAG